MKRLVNSHLSFATDAEEDQFVLYALNQMESQRDLMGLQTTSREYRPGSFLWRLDGYQLGYEQDFAQREQNNLLFRESNLSLNLPLTPVSQHGDKMSNDLLSTSTFFGPTAEGGEDENPAIDILMQRLKHRAKLTKLNEVGKAGLNGALIRGQEVMRAGLSEAFYMKPQVIEGVLYEGRALKDSQGSPVLMSDKWIKNDAYPDRQFLERDSAISVPAGAELIGAKPKVIMARTSKEPGADIKVIHYGDFFCDLNAETITASGTKGHVWKANAADLLINYAEETREKEAFDAYAKAASTGQLAGSGDPDPYTVRSEMNRWRDGEEEKLLQPVTLDPKGFSTRTYAEIWTRYDADGDGYPEDIYLLVDLATKTPVHYEYAALVLRWSDMEHPHPYIVQRIWPKMSRWTGRGYYELLNVWAEVSDRMLNRIEIDAATSGNVVFENPLATMQGIDGDGVQFRNGLSYQLRGNFSKDEALGVVTVQPANLEIFNSLMEKFVGRSEINAGLTSPADSTVADVPGQDTLGVAKILENTSNQSLRAREGEIVDGLTAMLITFVEIEIYTLLHTEGGLPALVKQVGKEKAQVLMDWIQAFPEDVRNVFEVSLTKAHSSQMVEVGQAIVNILKDFAALPPPMQQAFAEEYTNILKGIGATNPEMSIEKAMVASQEMAAQAAIAAEQEQAAIAAGQPPQPPAENR